VRSRNTRRVSSYLGRRAKTTLSGGTIENPRAVKAVTAMEMITPTERESVSSVRGRRSLCSLLGISPEQIVLGKTVKRHGTPVYVQGW
jgi:hypothetical protein